VTATFDCRIAFAETLGTLAETNEAIVAVCSDSVGSSNLVGFQKRWPDRLVNVGIAEQDMVGVGAGLANGGLLPFVCGAACFMTGRALEQIKVDLAYSDTNVKLCGFSSGMAYGELGPTHHSIEDFAWTRVIPNLVVIAPSDRKETAQAVRAAAEHKGPVYLRLSRMGVPDIMPDDFQFEIGKATTLRDGSDVAIITNGVLTCRALEAAEMLAAEGISARVINMATVQPLDVEAVVKAARETRGIVTCEEHSVRGGLGGAIAEVVVAHHPTRMKILGVPGIFAPTGSAAWLLDRFGMSPAGIAESSRAILNERHAS
jgi:transketolase